MIFGDAGELGTRATLKATLALCLPIPSLCSTTAQSTAASERPRRLESKVLIFIFATIDDDPPREVYAVLFKAPLIGSRAAKGASCLLSLLAQTPPDVLAQGKINEQLRRFDLVYFEIMGKTLRKTEEPIGFVSRTVGFIAKTAAAEPSVKSHILCLLDMGNDGLLFPLVPAGIYKCMRLAKIRLVLAVPIADGKERFWHLF
jgi:hypothetical protein